jgi:hypothetical protein
MIALNSLVCDSFSRILPRYDHVCDVVKVSDNFFSSYANHSARSSRPW